MRHCLSAICALLGCKVGRVSVGAREVLILLIIVYMRGLLEAAAGPNEERRPRVDFAYSP